MVVSTLVETTSGGEARRLAVGGTPDPTRFSEITLTPTPDLQQRKLIFENPVCRLAQRTEKGSAVCNKGCGLSDASGRTHDCPFGLRMMRVGNAAAETGPTRWVGRRFPSVDAMHNALDQLLGLGFDEETILAHLPPNPIATDDELRVAALDQANKALEEKVIEEKAPATRSADAGQVTPQAAEASGEEKLLNLLEYVEQVQALLATASQPAAVCERFLRVLTGMVPFEEMALYLQDSETGELVIAASVDEQTTHQAPRAQECRLAPESVGAQALAQRRMLIECEGAIRPAGFGIPVGGTLAIPLPLRPGHALGVWLAERGKDQYPARLGAEPVRVMRLLSSILSMRLQQMVANQERAEVAPAAEERVANDEKAVRRGREELSRVLEPEIARAAITGTRLALMRVQIACHGDGVAIPIDDIQAALRGVLRPYDQLAMNASLRDAWDVVLPLADDRLVDRMGNRLIEVIEDQLDACGGTEEQGLWVAVGVSMYGQDASSAAQMIEHAGAALRLANNTELDVHIRTYEESAHRISQQSRADQA